MPSAWVVSKDICGAHEGWAVAGGWLFSSLPWAEVLSSLGATSLFAWNSERQAGLVIPVFRKWGIKVGVLGFPVIGAPFDCVSSEQLTALARDIGKSASLDLVRVNQSFQRFSGDRAAASLPEVWIDSLQAWSVGDNKKRRKDLAFSARSASFVNISTFRASSADMFSLYKNVMSRRGGNLRYNELYFDAIVKLSADSDRVVIHSAETRQRDLIGFAVSAFHGEVGYYLHGAANDLGKNIGVTDLLLEAAIMSAKAKGAMRFSLMASPPDQLGLVKFKQKWGDHRGFAVTRDEGVSLVGMVAAKVAAARGGRALWTSRNASA